MDGDIGLASEDVTSPSPSVRPQEQQPRTKPHAGAGAATHADAEAGPSLPKSTSSSSVLDTHDTGDIGDIGDDSDGEDVASQRAAAAAAAAPAAVVDAEEQPVPVDAQQVDLDEQPQRTSPDANARSAAGDASDGAWSAAVAPREEEEKALGVDDEPPPVKAAAQRTSHESPPANAATQRPSHLHHARIESLPPQKFVDANDDDDDDDDEDDDDEQDGLHPYAGQRRPSHLHTMEEEIDLDAAADQAHEEQLAHLSEFERAGLDFVDINLDGGGVYGPGSMAASKSRTSLEIRTDFVSSDGRVGPPPPLPSSVDSAEQSASSSSGSSGSKLRFWRKNGTGVASGDSESSRHRPEPSSSPPPPPTPSKTPTMASYDGNGTPSISTDSLSRSRPVEGRYRGKLSRPASPASSPVLTKRASSLFGDHQQQQQQQQQQHVLGTLPPESPRSSLPSGMTMMVANEDGDVEVVDVGEVAGAADSDPQNEPMPDNLALPEPKANTNDSQDAIDVKAKELSAAASASARGGRSAGPSAVGLDDEAKADVRPETAAEAAAKQRASSTATGGRSAGPIVDGGEGQGTSSAASPAPSSTSTSTPTPKSGGRSAGPLLASFSSSRRGHARKPSNTPSALEKHVSRTRMTTLPPKARTEDQRHLRDFETMMKEFKAAEAKKAKEDEERQRRKEEELRVATQIWEDEILKDWRVARTNTRLRAVWWKGCPPSLRGRAWQLAIGNAQMLPRNLFTTTKARVAEFKTKGQWPPRNALFAGGDSTGLHEEDVCASMDADMERTLPSLKLFQKEIGPMHDDLREVLECLVLLRADQAEEMRLVRERDRANAGGTDAAATTATSPRPRQVARRGESLAQTSEAPAIAQLYVPGLSLLCATLLLNLSQAETLVGVLNLIHAKPWLRSIYSMDAARLRESEAFERVLNTLLADQLPKVYANMQAQGVRPSAYARDWIRNLFVPLLPFDAVCRLWDNLFLEEGDALLFRTCLALVSLLSSRLYVPDGAELTSILQGKNRAALSVWFRFLQTAPPGSPQAEQQQQHAHAHSPSPLSGGNFRDQASVQAMASLPHSPLAGRHRNYRPEGEAGDEEEEDAPRPSAAQASRSPLARAHNNGEGEAEAEGDGQSEDGESADENGDEVEARGESETAGSSSPPPARSPSPRRTPLASASTSNGGSSSFLQPATTAPIPTPTPTPTPTPNPIEAPDSWVPRDALFTIYAIGEDDVFAALEEQVGGWGEAGLAGGSEGGGGQPGTPVSVGAGVGPGAGHDAQAGPARGRGGHGGHGWWKESTLERLVDRELGG